MTLTDSVAAIDIGTNSALLTVANAQGQPIEERAEITRLGEGCDASGVLLEAAIDRTLAAIADYARVIREYGVERLAIAATSATRDAVNGADFCKRVESITGCAPEIVSGQREAELTFRGALSGLAPESVATASGELCVFDIGGGSTELIVGRKSAAGTLEIQERTSLNIGSVRLTERFVATNPPSQDEMEAIRDHVRSALATVTPPGPGAAVVGVAGTVTTLCAVANQVEPYDSALIHGATLTRESVDELIKVLSSLPLKARREVKGLAPKRADVIVAGAVLAQQILSWAGPAACTVSDRGVRWGLIAELIGE